MSRSNFRQGRYILRHPWRGVANKCPEAKVYLDRLNQRRDKEAKTLAELTGWDMATIREKMGQDAPSRVEDDPQWYNKLWKQ